uniref:Uncharacterized protein n=1 Tax=Arundo donax TaxID=35708 RepID=A0A0A8ZPA0_ARUDO
MAGEGLPWSCSPGIEGQCLKPWAILALHFFFSFVETKTLHINNLFNFFSKHVVETLIRARLIIEPIFRLQNCHDSKRAAKIIQQSNFASLL